MFDEERRKELRELIEQRLEQEAAAEIERAKLLGRGLKVKERKSPTLRLDGHDLRISVPVLLYTKGRPEGSKKTFYPDFYHELRKAENEALDRIAASAREEGTSLRGITRAAGKTRPNETPRRLSKSSIHRRSLRLDNAALEAIQSAPLGHLDLVAAHFDGLEVGGDTILFGVGISRDGSKHVLGLEVGRTESKQMVASFLGKLEKRGAPLSRMLLITDRGAGLREAIAEAGYSATTQICIVHVQRNIREHMLSKLEFDGVAARLTQARRGRRHKEFPSLRKVRDELLTLGDQEAAELLGGWIEKQTAGANRAPRRQPEREDVPAELRQALQQAMPASHWHGVRPYLHRAWAERDYGKAFGQLTAIEQRLFESGHRKAANTLREAMVGTLTVTRLGVTNRALRSALQSTNVIESFNGMVRRLIRKLSPSFRDADPLARPRWAAGAALNAARRWKRIEAPEAELLRLREAVAAIAAPAVDLGDRAADRLTPYAEVLGPRMLELHSDLTDLTARFASVDAAAREALRPATDPFQPLQAIVAADRAELVEHGARRLATSIEAYGEGNAPSASLMTALRRPGSFRMARPDSVLALYERELDQELVAEIKDRAGGLEEWAQGNAVWRSQCQRLYAEPFPPAEPFEEQLDKWLEEHGEQAKTLVALERAERDRGQSATVAVDQGPQAPSASAPASAREQEPDAAWLAEQGKAPIPEPRLDGGAVDLDALLDQGPPADAVAPPRRAPEERDGPPGIPTEPLRDSLFDGGNFEVLTHPVVVDLEARADALRASLALGGKSEQELREMLPESNPFDDLPRASDRTAEAMSSWWRPRQADIVCTVAVEGELIKRAAEAYAELGAKEEVRRKFPMANRMKEVRESRGAVSAARVARHAAVAASRLASKPEKERQRLNAEVNGEIAAAGGIGPAPFKMVVEQVAHQHVRNAGNAREAARPRDAGPDQAMDRGSAVAVGAELP